MRYKVTGFGSDDAYYDCPTGRGYIGKICTPVGLMRIRVNGSYSGHFLVEKDIVKGERAFLEVFLEEYAPINEIEEPEEWLLDYEPVYVKFEQSEINEFCATSGTFKLFPAMGAKLIRSANRTVVILDDGSKGIAKCGEDQRFSRNLGLRVAFNRALMARLEAENKRLFENEG